MVTGNPFSLYTANLALFLYKLLNPESQSVAPSSDWESTNPVVVHGVTLSSATEVPPPLPAPDAPRRRRGDAVIEDSPSAESDGGGRAGARRGGPGRARRLGGTDRGSLRTFADGRFLPCRRSPARGHVRFRRSPPRPESPSERSSWRVRFSRLAARSGRNRPRSRRPCPLPRRPLPPILPGSSFRPRPPRQPRSRPSPPRIAPRPGMRRRCIPELRQPAEDLRLQGRSRPDRGRPAERARERGRDLRRGPRERAGRRASAARARLRRRPARFRRAARLFEQAQELTWEERVRHADSRRRATRWPRRTLRRGRMAGL